MIRIGVVNIDTSHPKAFAEYLAGKGRAAYTGIYNDGFRGDDEVEGFMRKAGIQERSRSLADLADATDIGFIQGCDWDRHLECARPFLERGKPVFIDKPIVGNAADCRELEALSARGLRIFGSSSLRFAHEIVAFAAKPESERGKILGVFATAGVDEFNYAVHVAEGLGGLLGAGALSASFMGASSVEGKTQETYFARFQGGVAATFAVTHGVWQPFEFVITTTKSTFQFRVDTAKIYGALLDRICDAMEKGEPNLAPIADLTESVRLMLAGRLSRERGGGEVRLADIPPGDPGFDGAAFAKSYAAAAGKLYA
ncbi:MAG: hypothetical protein J0L75_11275 [Spirochaetes bacterium]|nr:hypothetical protein [Spirochaetota bacterium]